MFALAVPAGAQTGPHFERVGSQAGPPAAVITALYQDRAGFVWIGSRDGLTLYDGRSFVVFEHDASDPSSISDNSIRTIFEDREGRLWVGTNAGGLNRLDRSNWTFRHHRHDSRDPATISHDSVYAITQDRAGTIWVGTQVGLNRFDPQTGTFERMLADPDNPRGLTHDYAIWLHADDEGRVWVATLGGGLNVWQPGSSSFAAYRHDPNDPRTLTDDSVTCIAEDPAGILWIGTVGGLNRLDPRDGSIRRYEAAPGGLSDPLISGLALGPSGKLWIATYGGGLDELDMETGKIRVWRHQPDNRHSLSHDVLLALLADDVGTLWIGTFGGGLSRLTRTALGLEGMADGLPLPDHIEDNNVTSLLQDDHGGTWIGTRSGFLLRRDEQTGEFREYLRGGREGVGRILLGLAMDTDGSVLVGSNGGLLRVEPDSGTITEFIHDPTDPASIGPGYVRPILRDRQGRLWIGTGEGGVNRLSSDGSVLQRLIHDPSDPQSISDDYVTSLLEDERGTLWVGTRSGGLNAVDPDSGKAVRFTPDSADPGALSHHYVTSIFEDTRGQLWVGTSGGGLNRAERRGDDVRFRRYTEEDGLIDNDVMGILEDDDGSLWLSTKRGLARFDPDGGSFTAIEISDGLPSGEFESGSVARNGTTLWFGSVQGLVAIPAATPFPPSLPSPTVIRSIRTAEGEVHGSGPTWNLDAIEVPYGEWLSIELAVLDYRSERRHHYAYRLDDEWIDLAERREITFTGLKPGLRLFSSRGRNSEGVWTETTPELAIRVVPPYWMTWWFRAGGVMFIALLAFVWHQVRMSNLARRNKELVRLHDQREKARHDLALAYQRLRGLTRRLEGAKEEERKRIARELHDEMGPSLTAVIINLQLLSGDSDPERTRRKIEDTIDLVDRMVQRVRDLSLDLRPPLLDELGLMPALKGYFETQAERAGIEIDVLAETSAEGISPEVAIVAFRVAQEAVTNVIRHSGASRATVRVRRENGNLALAVEDDGRGFDVRATMDGAASGKVLGLAGMQERVRGLGGEVEIASTPGRGTAVRARLPTEVEP